MKARIIASAAEIGPFETLTFYGQPLTRDWSGLLRLSPEVERKLRGNRYLEVKDGATPALLPPAPPKTSDKQTDAERRAAVVTELTALGVPFKKSAKIDALEALLAEAKGPPISLPAAEDPLRAELIAQLEGLGVEFDPNADTEALEAALDAATAPTED